MLQPSKMHFVPLVSITRWAGLVARLGLLCGKKGRHSDDETMGLSDA